jgi:gamma-glutamylcyclotransferase (GGCT)/AIG2-like uncharacterized protein YtfP
MENLFSYGTLQLAQAQQEVFGRTMQMNPDALVGYKKEKIKIRVESVINLSGEEEHVIISYSGNDSDIIEGVVLSVAEEELKHADEYETDDYTRVEVRLLSGKSSWVYVKNDKK